MLGILAAYDIKVSFPPHDRTPIAKLFHATPDLHPPDRPVDAGIQGRGGDSGSGDG